MEKELRLENYGIKEHTNKSMHVVATGVSDCLGVLCLSRAETLYLNAGTLYKKGIDQKEQKEKVFLKTGTFTAKLAHANGTIALYNKEGVIKMADAAGTKLGIIECSPGPRSLFFLGADMLCVGGESCTLQIFLLSGGPALIEYKFDEYIDSISASTKYIAVSLASDEVHIFRYFSSSVVIGVSEKQEKREVRLEHVSVFSAGRPCVLCFLGESAVFLGLSSGAGYIYSIEEECITAEGYLHSKAIVAAEQHGPFIVTASLDGRLKISNANTLREVSSLYVGVPILSFHALFHPITDTSPDANGNCYLISTSSGEVVMYRDKQQAVAKSEVQLRKKPIIRTLYEHSVRSASSVQESVQVQINIPKRQSNIEGLLSSFQYRKALILAMQDKSTTVRSGVLAYLDSVGRIEQTIYTLPDKELASITDLCTEMLRYSFFFSMCASSISFSAALLTKRYLPKDTPLYEVVCRAYEEVKEECLIQEALHITAENINIIIALYTDKSKTQINCTKP